MIWQEGYIMNAHKHLVIGLYYMTIVCITIIFLLSKVHPKNVIMHIYLHNVGKQVNKLHTGVINDSVNCILFLYLLRAYQYIRH